MHRFLRAGGAAAGVTALAVVAASPGIAATAAAPRPVTSTCTAEDLWAAAAPTEAWLPVGKPLAGNSAFGYHQGFRLTQSVTETEASADTLGPQLRLASSTKLVPAGSGKRASFAGRVRWASTQKVTVDAGGSFSDPIHENVQPFLFLTGYRATVTLYRETCSPTKRLRKLVTKPVFLYARNVSAAVGWVAVGVTPHPVVQSWASPNITNP